MSRQYEQARKQSVGQSVSQSERTNAICARVALLKQLWVPTSIRMDIAGKAMVSPDLMR